MKRRIAFMLIGLLGAYSLIAQISVTGKVTDSDGIALPGVNVFLKGTTNGTITDIDGNYSISVDSEASIIIFSYVGMLNEEITVGTQKEINVMMMADLKSLDEVVVVGYGTVKKSDLTGSVASIDSEELIESRNPTTVGAIQGKVAGVDIVRSNNKPGGGFSINVRGVSTFGDVTSPLYVVDGIVIENLNDINPEDIQRIDILKDASSSAIYGSRGTNGVVIITTNSGEAGRTVVNYNGYAGVKQAYNLPEIMNTQQFVDFALASAEGAGNTAPVLADMFNPDEIENINRGISTNWPELLCHNGFVTNHSLNISGGSEGHIFDYGMGYLSEDGVVGEEKYERYTIKSSNEKKINDWLSLGIRNNMAYAINNGNSTEAFRSAYRLRPTGDPYDADGELQLFPYTREGQITNPLLDVKHSDKETRSIHYFGNIFIKLTPVQWLSFRSTFSPDIYYQRFGEYHGLLTKDARGEQDRTKGYYSTNNYLNYTWDNIMDIKKSFGANNLSATLVTSVYKHRQDESYIERRGYATDSYSFYNIESGSNLYAATSQFEQETMASFLGRISYDLSNKYYLTANGRYDGSSRLASGHKWAFFPSTAIAWRISEEDFMQDIGAISLLKARLSYGTTGNATIDYYKSQVSTANSYYAWGEEPAPGISIDQIANYELTWERTKEFNLGIDFGLFKNRIYGNLEIYNRLSEQILFNRNIPVITGYSSVSDNMGTLNNRGIELALNTVNVRNDNFRWTTTLTFSSNKNKIIDIYGTKEDDEGNELFIGEDINSFWYWEKTGIWQTSEAADAAVYSQDPGEVKVKDQNNDNVIDSRDKIILGKATPDWYGSIINTVNYKGFDLSVFVYTRQGQMSYSKFHEKFAWDQDGRFNGLALNYWTPSNTSGTWHQPGNGGVYRKAENYQDLSFVKVGYINFGYNFNDKVLEKIKATKLRAYVSLQNPFVFTKYEGFDPEYSNDTWDDTFMTRSFLFGLNVQF